MDATQGNTACLERLKGTCAEDNAAVFEILLRMQRNRAVTSAAETEGAVTRAAEREDYPSDESEGVYLKVAYLRSSVLVPGLGGDRRLAELGKEPKANKPVPELGEDKANQAGEVLPAAVIVLRVVDVLDTHADHGSRFITRL